MRYPMITGHTGNDGTPPNSIQSINKSIFFGADAFEVDIRKDRNSVLVLSHYAQNQEGYNTCLRLTEAFEIAAQHPEIHINCDLKDDNLPLEVASLAHSFGISANRLILSGTVTPSFLTRHPEIVEMADIYLNVECVVDKIYFQKISQSNKLQQDTTNHSPWNEIKKVASGIDPYIEILSETCLKYGVKGINISYVCLTDKNIRDFEKRGIPLSVWTVNDQVEMARLFSCHVENITTLRVAEAKSVRKNLLGF